VALKAALSSTASASKPAAAQLRVGAATHAVPGVQPGSSQAAGAPAPPPATAVAEPKATAAAVPGALAAAAGKAAVVDAGPVGSNGEVGLPAAQGAAAAAEPITAPIPAGTAAATAAEHMLAAEAQAAAAPSVREPAAAAEPSGVAVGTAFEALLPPPVGLPAEVAAPAPWQQQLAALAQQVINGVDPTPEQLVSLCLWPQVSQFSTYRAGVAGGVPPLLPSTCQQLRSWRVPYTRAVWAARLLLAGMWLAVEAATITQEGRYLPPSCGEHCWACLELACCRWLAPVSLHADCIILGC
jgi:hypothetical protein